MCLYILTLCFDVIALSACIFSQFLTFIKMGLCKVLIFSLVAFWNLIIDSYLKNRQNMCVILIN